MEDFSNKPRSSHSDEDRIFPIGNDDDASVEVKDSSESPPQSSLAVRSIPSPTGPSRSHKQTQRDISDQAGADVDSISSQARRCDKCFGFETPKNRVHAIESEIVSRWSALEFYIGDQIRRPVHDAVAQRSSRAVNDSVLDVNCCKTCQRYFVRCTLFTQIRIGSRSH